MKVRSFVVSALMALSMLSTVVVSTQVHAAGSLTATSINGSYTAGWSRATRLGSNHAFLTARNTTSGSVFNTYGVYVYLAIYKPSGSCPRNIRITVGSVGSSFPLVKDKVMYAYPKSAWQPNWGCAYGFEVFGGPATYEAVFSSGSSPIFEGGLKIRP